MDSYNANKCYKVLGVLHSDMQRAYAECGLKQLDPTVKLVDSLMQLPLPADMRHQVSSKPATDYFPAEIQDYILNEQSVAVTYHFKVDKRTITLHFVLFNKRTSSLNMSKLLEHAKRVCALMHLVSMHANRATCSSTLNIFIYMTHFNKLLPDEKGKAIDTEHVNTGMAYHCAKTNDIVVYRKEEWFKVLIHESFHAFGLSFIESDMEGGVDAAMQSMLKKMYAISHPVRVYETYCEIWARILNVMFACFSPISTGSGTGATTKDPISTIKFAAFAECVMEGLHRDAQHALQQCAKIMHHMGIPDDAMMNPTKDNRDIVAKKYRENTNVFAYYVMTCALQHSPDVFMVWCHKNNPRAKMMQFLTIPSNFNGFMEMLHHCKHRCPRPDVTALYPPSSSMRMTAPSRTDDMAQ
jgi:hypothetical protein